MDLAYLIKHPEQLDKETLYDLRNLIAVYPYYQTARILMLQNLYLLHDSTFDEELRRAAIYITDRKKLFQMVEAAHYQLRKEDKKRKKKIENDGEENRTVALIDNFLETVPVENENAKSAKRKPTPADAAIDYVAYLLQSESLSGEEEEENIPQMEGQNLIDNCINKDGGKIELKETLEYTPDFVTEIPEDQTSEAEANDEYFTETLARIYIQQKRYSKALEIIQRLNLLYPKKNRYFADQIRFLEKLIINNKHK